MPEYTMRVWEIKNNIYIYVCECVLYFFFSVVCRLSNETLFSATVFYRYHRESWRSHHYLYCYIANVYLLKAIILDSIEIEETRFRCYIFFIGFTWLLLFFFLYVYFTIERFENNLCVMCITWLFTRNVQIILKIKYTLIRFAFDLLYMYVYFVWFPLFV